MKKQILITSIFASVLLLGLKANAIQNELYQLPCAAEVAQAALAQASFFISDEDLSCTKVTVNLLADSGIETRFNYKGEQEKSLRYVGFLSFSHTDQLINHHTTKNERWEVRFQAKAKQVSILEGAVACHFSKLEYSPAPQVQISAARLKLNKQALAIPLDRIFESKLSSPDQKCPL